MVVYVDDILTGKDYTLITALKKVLNDLFSIKDLGQMKYYLG